MYRRLTVGFVCRSVAALTAGSAVAFAAMETASGNEEFYANWLIPAMHYVLDPERAHAVTVKLLKNGLMPISSSMKQEYPELQITVFGRQFKNCFGLAAGFDKDAECTDALCKAGFGFVEVGSVTPKPQPGNEPPRIHRLIADRALINHCGFNSQGFAGVFERMQQLPVGRNDCLIGVNVGKNKDSKNFISDYSLGLDVFSPCADYIVVNVSSPNTTGLRDLQRKQHLRKLLVALHSVRTTIPLKRRKPLLLKVSPDLTFNEKKDIAELCLEPFCHVDGLIVSNTTTSRPVGMLSDVDYEGGLSGPPLQHLSTQCIKDFYRLTKGQVPIIGCGGISSGKDAYEKLKAGASLLQIYTVITYEGMPVLGRLKRELVSCLLRDGYRSISDVIGIDSKKKDTQVPFCVANL
ncbi:dihydroorotate dehydrogenase (quinone) [Trichuris trichiura]|uniref:Dihydroorotate dehydrogenase (quinone), mitochondrial n=1 Tax=Trichuris trichiura TaxID=36087 RepID=A0A077Z0K9_TRITR|nr:dihydroorotate dehydrogenase (quinone) [Trichuris trichiura]